MSFWHLILIIHNFCLRKNYPTIFIQHKGMIWEFVFPAPHPKYVHPTGTIIIFSHLQVNGHFEQKIFKTPYVPDGCTYCSNILGRGNQVPKVCFDVIFDDENFWNFYSLILREFGPVGRFGTHFHRVIKCVLGMLYSKNGFSDGGRGR